jgi:hypothetical protein
MSQFVETVSTFPRLSIVPRTDNQPRCPRCSSILVTTHLACDDGAVIPIVYCPICSNTPKSQSRPISKTPRTDDDMVVDIGLAARSQDRSVATPVFTDD